MSNDGELERLLAQLNHVRIRERENAVSWAKALLTTGRHREALLAALTQVVENEDTLIVREAAQAVLDEMGHGASDASIAHPDESKHRFPLACYNCNHVNWYDKRVVCPADGKVKRTLVERGGLYLDKLLLTCEQCDAELVHEVDCRGYK